LLWLEEKVAIAGSHRAAEALLRYARQELAADHACWLLGDGKPLPPPDTSSKAIDLSVEPDRPE
jgi:hypothetical protein